MQQLKHQIFRDTVLQFIILYTNIEKEKQIIVNGRRMLRIFLHLASKGLVSNCFSPGTFTPPSLDLTLAFPACRADTPSATPSKITDGVAWVKNNSAWLVPEFSSKQQNRYYSISVQRRYIILRYL